MNTDNPNPIINCTSGGEDAVFSITVFNNDQAGNRNVRAYLPQVSTTKLIFVNEPGLDFTCVKDLPSGAKEFWITEPNCGTEKTFFFEPNEMKTFRFKVRLTSEEVPGGQGGYAVTSYAGGNSISSNLTKRDFTILPYVRVNVANYLALPSYLPGGNPLHIVGGPSGGAVGVFQMDDNYDFKKHKKIRFDPAVDMRITNNKTVTMPEMDIRGCQNMWKSITVFPGSTLDVKMSTVEDGQFALQCQKGGTLSVTNSTLRNNNFGIITSSVGQGTHKITALGNRYLSTALKPAYANQSPAPGSKGFAGIYVDNVAAALNIGEGPTSGFLNEFDGLHFGILTKNTVLNVSKSMFTNIVQSTMPSGYTSYVAAKVGTGRGIYATGKSLTVTGIPASSFPNFDNCHTGIETLGAGLTATGNTMTNVNNGIVNRATVNRNIRISSNTISARSLGIGVLEQQESPGQCVIIENTIGMSGSSAAQGISIGSGTSWMWGSATGGQVTNNTVTMSDGFDGIYLGVSQAVTADRNTVLLKNTANNRSGIRVDGGAFNAVKCNTITSTGTFADASGIRALLAGQSSFLCNTANGANRGLSFDGMAIGHSGAISISGNRMNNNTDAGLLFGEDAVVGPQKHQGNRWASLGGQTMATHLGGVGLAINSLFTVDALETPIFIPSFVDPPEWFVDINDPEPSYTCNPVVLCPLDQVVGDGAMDRKIARGDISGLAHPAAQIWLAQRRLSERIQTDGNPYPGDADLASFISTSQSSGLAAYAQVQTGLRQMAALVATDQAQLNNFEIQTEQLLSILDQAENQLHRYGISPQDSITWVQQRDSVLLVLENVGADQSTKLGQIAAARTIVASNLLSLNAALVGNSTWQTNEKTVNDIYLNTIARGLFDFTAVQQTSLENIAAQCPVADGEAVLRARTMLTLVQDAPVAYDDAALCSGREQQRASNALGAAVRIYPNPASDKIVVEYSLTAETDHSILLINAFGQSLGAVNLPDQTGRIQISVAHLPAGVYWYVVPGAAASSGKFIINR